MILVCARSVGGSAAAASLDFGHGAAAARELKETQLLHEHVDDGCWLASFFACPKVTVVANMRCSPVLVCSLLPDITEARFSFFFALVSPKVVVVVCVQIMFLSLDTNGQQSAHV